MMYIWVSAIVFIIYVFAVASWIEGVETGDVEQAERWETLPGTWYLIRAIVGRTRLEAMLRRALEKPDAAMVAHLLDSGLVTFRRVVDVALTLDVVSEEILDIVDSGVMMSNFARKCIDRRHEQLLTAILRRGYVPTFADAELALRTGLLSMCKEIVIYGSYNRAQFIKLYGQAMDHDFTDMCTFLITYYDIANTQANTSCYGH